MHLQDIKTQKFYSFFDWSTTCSGDIEKVMKRLFVFTLICAFFGIFLSKTYTYVSRTIVHRFPLHPLPPNTCKTKYWNPVSPEQIPKPLGDDVIDIILLEAPVFSWKLGPV